MRYRELLDKYKKNELSEEQMKQIESDIEKQEAISEYLLDWEEQDGFYVLKESTQKNSAEAEKDSKKADEFTRMVNRKIRRAFLKMGTIVAIVTTIVVLSVIFVLPNVVDEFYYDPGEVIAEGWNQMSVDMLVYTDLLFPMERRQTVVVDDKGYGEYDISVKQGVSYTSEFRNVSGEIIREKLKLYNENILMPPTRGCFMWFVESGGTDETKLSELGEENGWMISKQFREVELSKLKGLDEDDMYIGYITLDQMMRYEEFTDFLMDMDLYADVVWCAVKTKEWVDGSFSPDNIGFQCMNRGEFEWDNTYLSFKGEDWAFSEEYDAYVEQVGTEKSAQEHLVNMLTYMAGQEAFLEMMGEYPERFSSAADYVRENGVMIYGFATVLDKETALELSELDGIYCIQMEEIR